MLLLTMIFSFEKLKHFINFENYLKVDANIENMVHTVQKGDGMEFLFKFLI